MSTTRLAGRAPSPPASSATAPVASRAGDIPAIADKPALVTGASGFVGSAVARALLAAGRKVRVLLRPASDRRNIADLDVDVRHGSLEDHESFDAPLAGCGAVLPVAP